MPPPAGAVNSEVLLSQTAKAKTAIAAAMRRSQRFMPIPIRKDKPRRLAGLFSLQGRRQLRGARAPAAPPSPIFDALSRLHHLFQMLGDLVDEAAGGQPALLVADEQGEILGHIARL